MFKNVVFIESEWGYGVGCWKVRKETVGEIFLDSNVMKGYDFELSTSLLEVTKAFLDGLAAFFAQNIAHLWQSSKLHEL